MPNEELLYVKVPDFSFGQTDFITFFTLHIPYFNISPSFIEWRPGIDGMSTTLTSEKSYLSKFIPNSFYKLKSVGNIFLRTNDKVYLKSFE